MNWIYSLPLAPMSMAEGGAMLEDMAPQEMGVAAVEEAIATTGMRSHHQHC